jgi:2-methylfumaryl-CoA isomerase
MYELLSGLRVLEVASFIAAPSCALHLRQLGADVIRCDPIGGGPDFNRWPIAGNGASLYWEGLNKDKKSVALDLGGGEGRELLLALAAAVGRLVTNLPAAGFLSHEALAARREDMLTLRVMGWADGGQALDYTVNAALGVPLTTGPEALPKDQPVNHVLPAWDLSAGAYAAFAFLAADRRLAQTGRGGEIRVPLADVALASLGAMGQIAETALQGCDRPRYGNDLFGAFGRDFITSDGRRVMLAAITPRQWSGLLKALQIEAAASALEAELGVSFLKQEGLRFKHRDRLNPLVAEAVARLRFEEAAERFKRYEVTWGPYQTLTDALAEDPRIRDSGLLSPAMHLSGLTYPTPGAIATLAGEARGLPGRAARLGEHSEEVLSDVLGLSATTIAGLIDRGVVGTAERL